MWMLTIQDIWIAVLAGVMGTTVMTGMQVIAAGWGLPAIDVSGILGRIISTDHQTPVGYVVHWVNGVIFALLYFIAFRWFPGNLILWGFIWGTVHWLLVGWMFALAPLAHMGMKAGTVKIPGAYMLKSLGVPGFIAGWVGHIAFGLTVASVYGWLA